MMTKAICVTTISCVFGLMAIGCQSYVKAPSSENPNEMVAGTGVPLESVHVEMDFVSKRSPYGSRSKGGYPFEFFNKVPRTVTKPPPGKTLHYGELAFLDSVTFLFAISLSAGGEKNALFYLDANRNGDFTDDNPQNYTGMGTKGTATNFSMKIPRPDGTTESYGIWLWTTLEADASAVSNLVDPGFNYYANCHKAGTLSLETNQGLQEIRVTAVDGIDYDGSYKIDKVIVDWNGNKQLEDVDVFPVGETMFYQGVLLTLVEVGPYADAIVFSLDRTDTPRRKVLDVEADLALEPIVGNAPPPLDVMDIDGQPVLLEEYKGKVILIDFWATWCPPCSEELPNVLDTYNRYHDQGFEIIGVSLDTDGAALDAFLKDNKVTWRQIYDGKAWKGTIPQRYRVSGIPMPILVGRDGMIVSLQARGSSLPALVAAELAK